MGLACIEVSLVRINCKFPLFSSRVKFLPKYIYTLVDVLGIVVNGKKICFVYNGLLSLKYL